MEEGCVFKAKLLTCLVCSMFVFISSCDCQSEDSGSSTQSVLNQRFKLEGKVAVPGASEEWMSSVRILVDGGQYLGLLKSVTLLDTIIIYF